MTMTFLRVSTDMQQRSEPVNVEGSIYDTLSKGVGGYIEAVYMPADATLFPNCVIYINEEAKLIGLPVNQKITYATRGVLSMHDMVCGDAMVTGPTDPIGDCTSIPEDAMVTFRLWEASIRP